MFFFTVGYGLIWLLIIGYTAVIHKQQSHMERQLFVLEEIVAEREKAGLH